MDQLRLEELQNLRLEVEQLRIVVQNSKELIYAGNGGLATLQVVWLLPSEKVWVWPMLCVELAEPW